MTKTKAYYQGLFQPAFWLVDASGKEKKACKLCGKRAKKDEHIVELYSSSFKLNYTNRFCYDCFLKTLILAFPELLDIY